MKKIFLLLTMALCVLASCSSSRKVASSTSSQDIENLAPEEKVNWGYGEVSKDGNTQSISRLVPAQEEVITYTNMTEYIRGKVPGVMVTPEGKFLIRGISSINSSTDPLILLDGTPIDDINNVSPMDVFSVDVIKDGSSAIYGVRGANGVIMITTKSGRELEMKEKAERKRQREAEKAARKAKKNK